MRIISSTNRAAVQRVVMRNAAVDRTVVTEAGRIVRDVRRRGDEAVREWSRRFGDPAGDSAATAGFEIPRRRWHRGWADTPRHVRVAIRTACRHVERVATQQRATAFAIQVCAGVRIEQRVQPFGRVCCYVPGGRHPLPSTLVMTVIPAAVAGVRDILVACPSPTPVVLCAALEAGATRVLSIGGAQAIAAVAYGTRTIPRVDKIVGPGNAWVAAAKAAVARDCATDLHAGPSEIVVWADEGRPGWIAADLVAQAEHDPAARAILVTTNRRLAERVASEVRQYVRLSGVASASIRRHGAAIVASSRDEALDLVNRIAPEHLVCANERDAKRVRTAGTIFVGIWSVQAAGDYTTGSNHVLPTGGAARFRGGLSTADFVRVFTVQTLTRRGLRLVGPPAAALADAEGLSAHARSIRIRL